MNVFVGLDVSLRSVALCVIDGDGTIIEERTLDCEVNAIADHLPLLNRSIERVGFEAGTMSQMLYHGLTAKGFDVVCMETRQVTAALSAMRNSEAEKPMIQ